MKNKILLNCFVIFLFMLVSSLGTVTLMEGGSLDNAKVTFDVTSGTPSGVGLFIFDVPENGGYFDHAAVIEPTGDYVIYEDGFQGGATYGFVYPYIETLNYVLIVLNNDDRDGFYDFTADLICWDSGSSDNYSDNYGDSVSGDTIWQVIEVEFDDETPECNLVAHLSYYDYSNSNNPVVDAKYTQALWNSFNTIILDNFVDDDSFPYQVLEDLLSYSFEDPYY